MHHHGTSGSHRIPFQHGVRNRPVGLDRFLHQHMMGQVGKRIDRRIDDRDQRLHHLIFAAAGNAGMELDILTDMIAAASVQLFRLVAQPFERP